MHYEEFEWRLFREGSLSTKMKAEMMDHLRTCDTCLTSYLAATEGQSSEQGATRVNSVSAEKRKVYRKPTPRIWRLTAGFGIAMVVFLLMLFTPQGKTALAQIRESLYEIGTTFLQRFGLEEDSPYVLNVDQQKGIHTEVPSLEGAEVRLDQVIIEPYSLSYSILVSGNIPAEVNGVRFFEMIEIDGEMPLKSGGGTSYRLKDDPDVLLYTMTFDSNIDLFEKETHHIKIRSNQMELRGNTIYQRVEGPWVFEFDVSTKALEADTRIIQLSETITLGKTHYAIEQLQISPIRQRFVVRKTVMGADGTLPVEQVSPRNGNLIGFMLESATGEAVPFEFFEGHSDEMGVVLSYEPKESHYELMMSVSDWHVTPYVSEKTFIPNDTVFNGYTALESTAFDVYQAVSTSQ